jgi:hypothetical protein
VTSSRGKGGGGGGCGGGGHGVALDSTAPVRRTITTDGLPESTSIAKNLRGVF